ncbi:M28 family peptidase [Shewanella avicenniae]|uniref:M28 family peptidase n=1 Tax=Shewanella avicenniae TaxID=2814294 RepID=A0ABX7QN77_9GAMM|nr:M28 family metallopeptidase [Shewanella avicenniae]QSX32210.1 M28 family peptidase [Shewanella avicenniae]
MRLIVPLCSAALLIGCTQQSHETQYQAKFDEQLFRQDFKTLASDEFEGRAPTTHGEKLTIDYLSNAFAQIGFAPAANGSYLQKVPMVSFTPSEDQQVTLAGLPLQYRKDVVLTSRHDVPEVAIENAPLVFVGYGINAPEYDWNDYQGLDMKGKIAVILVNDPGFAAPDSGKFGGKAMTYYGRWSYKYEEASRQGALGAIIIHDTAPASYPWSVVENSWTGPMQELADNGADYRIAVEGWMTKDAAEQVFKASGLDLQAASERAVHGPIQLPLEQTAAIHFNNHAEYADSYNVVATLKGTDAAAEQILLTSHWDHIGKDDSLDGDQIFNGAMDNAAGVSGLLALARQMVAAQKAGQPLKRSITIVVTTGEEQGLLGSRYYAAHPLYPLQDTVAVFNMDTTNVFGRTKDYTIIGKGQSELELYLEKAAGEMQRTATAEAHPESGGYFRSDHFSFAKYGVPAVFAGGGSEPVDQATADYREKMEQLGQGCYHNTCDEYHEEWNLAGTFEDLTVYFNAIRQLGNSQDRPGYYPGSEFYQLRPATGIKLK